MPGDTVIFSAGTYKDSSFTILCNNVTVCAETSGSVYLNGHTSVIISGNSVTFSGFQFTSGANDGIVITVTGDDDSLSELNFSGYSAKKYISLAGRRDVISKCNFENKPANAPKGNLIHIETRKDGEPNNAVIRYCSFKHMSGSGGDNGNECIRITNGKPSSYNCGTVVEYCFFTDTGGGDSEVISVKSAGNTLRYNTMSDNMHANFCFRNGNNNSAYGNKFVRSGGIRIKNASDITCTNNYFEDCGDGKITAPVKYVPVSGVHNHERIVVSGNTFNGGSSIELCGDASGNTWENNIFVNKKNPIFTGDSTGIEFSGNRYCGTLGLEQTAGFTETELPGLNNY